VQIDRAARRATAEHRRRAGGGQRRRRRRERRRDGRRPARFPINLRYPREWRDTLEKLRALPCSRPRAQQITLGTWRRSGSPTARRCCERKRAPVGWVYVDVRGRDLASVVHDMQRRGGRAGEAAAGLRRLWSGQFEYLERANARLKVVVPATLAIIFVLLYLTFRRSTRRC
jgi:Cu(I)/Ag(I) efflux system membrane protein CusA/SilA